MRIPRVLSSALVVALTAGCGSATVVPGSEAASFPRSGVAKALHADVTEDGGVYEASIPRNDLQVSRRGVPVVMDQDIEISFLPRPGGSALVMGEIAATEREEARLVPALLAAGIEVTAVHNHLTELSPAIEWAHFTASGDPVRIATAVHRVLQRTTATQFPVAEPGTTSPLHAKALAKILGGQPTVEDHGVEQVGVDRADDITMNGVVLPPDMGVNALVYFQPLPAGRAATTGEMCLTGPEVEKVLRTLRRQGLTITALHSHMIDTTPATFFVHWWGTGSPGTLAKKVRAVLDAANYDKA